MKTLTQPSDPAWVPSLPKEFQECLPVERSYIPVHLGKVVGEGAIPATIV
jgi:hypothetical protein